MSKPWVSLATVTTDDGPLELRRRDRDDFLILVAGRVLMNSRESRSEIVLGERACAHLTDAEGAKRVLIGGLGMGITLRAVLDTVGASCAVEVAELHPTVADWCQGPLAELTQGAALDPRVQVRIEDVADVLRGAPAGAYDAIVLDLFEGPHAKTHPVSDPLYGRKAIDAMRRALAPGGVIGVWAEARDEGFEQRLQRAGLAVESVRPGRGGFRHWVVLARAQARG